MHLISSVSCDGLLLSGSWCTGNIRLVVDENTADHRLPLLQEIVADPLQHLCGVLAGAASSANAVVAVLLSELHPTITAAW